jgi:hypothetical protein
MFLGLFHVQPIVNFTMCDQSNAIVNALKEHFPDAINLSCYFHILQNIKKHWHGHEKYAKMMLFVKDCHHSKDALDYENIWNVFVALHENDLSLDAFFEYLDRITDEQGDWFRWQHFVTPKGFATTDNPLENHNNVLKKVCTSIDFRQWRKGND